MSFPYVRDWINEHPFKNTPDAHLICNVITGVLKTRCNVDYDESVEEENYQDGRKRIS